MRATIQIRVDDKLNQAVKAYAEKCGLTPSEMIKRWAVDKIGFDNIYGQAEKIEHKPRG